MSSKIQAVRGTQDMVGEEAARFDQVIETFTRVRKLYGFRPVQVPVFEFTGVFARSLGETTDVVSKEMYTFEDRGGESLTLRPEFTAGIARAYISNGWQQHAPMKLAAWGPAFRYERPQKGRFRQFHQLDAEILGSGEPAADVEIIALAQHLLDELGLQGKTVLNLNTLGDPETRAAWQAALIAHFSAHRDALSAESRERLEKNPLRILDSKDAADKALVADAPRIDAYMSAEAGAWFDAVRKGLDAAGIAYQRNEALVRGLDYYRHTTFEFITDHLGAQGTVLGGGRYDGLMEALGGPHTPCVGWAAGIERLAMLIEAPAVDTVEAVIVPVGEAAETAALALIERLRRSGVAADMAFKGNMKKRMAKASASGAMYALILGDDELSEGKVTVRNLIEGKQATAPLDAIGQIPLSLLWGLSLGHPKEPGTSYIGQLLTEYPGNK
ncbi:histidine--tRNA ligase [Sphingosinicella microcystinivorans]|uniref:Histidine--tRNA ligase n=1 Tax=Sphingosinicella microcystinivorans TaxID=335406 RepID=A0AAD1D481_SPHMI|nr:histidine--tRNA ligase [Sphingosinicella microcystinivorans]RKS90556.1 histidyl-tRNA synthetase [Sphingosinicella microcystinivorans]BBE33471.1 histidine--tRNA ligase [Sphingosinicella microcystinivorans]